MKPHLTAFQEKSVLGSLIKYRDMFAYDIHSFDTVSSTNDIVKQAIRDGCKPGFVAVAKSQESGHGMRGRPWVSPYGGLYMSICAKPKCREPNLPSITRPIGICIKDVLQEFSSKELAIKEPNDVVLSGNFDIPHKLVGISTEYLQNCLCLGIGVNVFNLSNNVYNVSKIECEDKRNVPVYLSDIAKENKLLTLTLIRNKILYALRDKLDIWQ